MKQWINRVVLGRILAGKDQYGNKFYESTERYEGVKPKRWMESRKAEYDVNEMDASWEAWLRWRRIHPPTIEKEIVVKEEEEQQGLQQELRLHQAARLAKKKKDMGHEPTGQGDTFQPGVWHPENKHM